MAGNLPFISRDEQGGLRLPCFNFAQSRENFASAADTAHAWKDVIYRIRVAFRSSSRHSVFGEHLLISALIGVARSAFYAKLSGDSAEDDGIELAAA
jgi:hypothetical protein